MSVVSGSSQLDVLSIDWMIRRNLVKDEMPLPLMATSTSTLTSTRTITVKDAILVKRKEHLRINSIELEKSKDLTGLSSVVVEYSVVTFHSLDKLVGLLNVAVSEGRLTSLLNTLYSPSNVEQDILVENPPIFKSIVFDTMDPTPFPTPLLDANQEVTSTSSVAPISSLSTSSKKIHNLKISNTMTSFLFFYDFNLYFIILL